MTGHDPRYRRGIELFNQEDFFEAHEVWEELWHDTQGGERDFYQGLIQMTSAMHHMQIGNMRGARILYESGILLLGPYGASHRGLDLDRLRSNFTLALEGLLNVPLDQLAGRGHPGPIRIPYSSERAFKLSLENTHGPT